MNIGKRVVEIVISAKDDASREMKAIGSTLGDLTKQFPALSILGGMALKDIVGKLADLGRAAVQAYKDMVQLGAGFEDMSNRTDLSTETLAKWKYIAEQGGTSLEEFEAVFRKLRKSMADAVNGDQAAIDTFRKLGVAFKDSAGNMRDLETVMLEVGQVVREHGSASVQGAAAQDVLGRASAGVVSILKQETFELQRQGEEAKVYSNNMTSAWSAAADASDDAAARFKIARQNAMAGLMPNASGAQNFFTELFIKAFNAKGWVELQKFDEDWAKKTATHTAETYVGSLIEGLNAAAGDSSPTAEFFAELDAKDRKAAAEAGKRRAELVQMMAGMGKDGPSVNAGAWQGLGGGGFASITGSLSELMAQVRSFDMTSENMPVIFDADGLEQAWAEHEKIVESLKVQIETVDELTIASQNLAMNLGDVASEGIQAFLMGEAAGMKFGTMIRTVIMSAIGDLIARLIVVKGLMSVFGSIFSIGGLAQGGTIPRAARGYSVPDGPRGMDSRLIAAMPGEEVISRQLSQKLDRFLSSMEFGAAVSPFALSGAGGGRGSVVVNFEVGRPVGVLDALSYGEVAATAARKVAEANL